MSKSKPHKHTQSGAQLSGKKSMRKNQSGLLNNNAGLDTTNKENQPTDNVPSESLPQNDRAASSYFKSLNSIEDTIKFMEENIIGKHGPQASAVMKDGYPVMQRPPEGHGEDRQAKACPPLNLQGRCPGQTSQERAIRPEADGNDKNLNLNDAVSFTLTARSAENSPTKSTLHQSERKTSAQRDASRNFRKSTERDASLHERDDFVSESRAQVMEKKQAEEQTQAQPDHSEALEQCLRPELSACQGPESQNALEHHHPARFFEGEGPSHVPEGDTGNYLDEGIMDIERIKSMLENTRKDLERMNQVNFEFPHLTLNKGGKSGQSSCGDARSAERESSRAESVSAQPLPRSQPVFQSTEQSIKVNQLLSSPGFSTGFPACQDSCERSAGNAPSVN